MKYDKTQKNCLACPIGYTSEKESSLNCTKCPEKKAPERRGRKHAKVSKMVWVMALFLMLLFLFLHCLSVCLLFLFLFPVLVVIVFPWLITNWLNHRFIDWAVVVELWVYPVQVFGWLFINVTWNFCLSVKIFVIKGCHQEMGSILLTNMRVIFATLDSIKINMVPHSVSNARMDSQQLRRDQPP